jgi:hypothetical protein
MIIVQSSGDKFAVGSWYSRYDHSEETEIQKRRHEGKGRKGRRLNHKASQRNLSISNSKQPI